MHIWVVSNPFALMSNFLLQSVLSPGWLQPLLLCPRSPVLGWVHTGGAQYSFTAEAGEGKRRISWGSPSHPSAPGLQPVVCSCKGTSLTALITGSHGSLGRASKHNGRYRCDLRGWWRTRMKGGNGEQYSPQGTETNLWAHKLPLEPGLPEWVEGRVVQSWPGGVERGCSCWPGCPWTCWGGGEHVFSPQRQWFPSTETHLAVTGRLGHSELAWGVGNISGHLGPVNLGLLVARQKGLSWPVCTCTELLKWQPDLDG